MRFSSSADRHANTGNTSYHSYNDTYHEIQSRVVEEAQKWLGVPYCYGGESHNCTDCSGFVMQVFAAVGVELPRTAARQFLSVEKIDPSESAPGDLVFFSRGGSISHVGIYTGNNEIIHASSSRGVIMQSLEDSYLRKTYAGMGRVMI